MNISNYFQYNENLSAGAQPIEADFIELKANGYEAIVNISTFSARNALANEGKIIENLKMEYVHFPVDCSNLRPFHYQTFKGIMNGLEGKKVFVHCAGNIKSSNLLHMYNVLEKKVNEKESVETLRKIQNPEEKWLIYFRSFGMLGINN